MNRVCLTSAAVLVLMGISGYAMAHGGEDHGQETNAHSSVGEAAMGTVAARRLADGSLFVPKNFQRQLGLRTVLANITEIPDTVELNGKVIADPNAGGRVQASQSGRMEPGPKGLPTLGQEVTKGEVLAWLRPVASSIERSNQQSQLAELESQLAIAERKVKRFDQLEGAVPQAAIDAARIERDALRKRRAAVGASINTPEALRAPASGVVSAAHVVVGQVVEAKEILFEIVDPKRLAVEALAYDPALANGIASASARLAEGVLELQFVGGGKQLRDQALPLMFRVKSGNDAVAVGQPLKIIATTSRTSKGAAAPQEALVKSGTGESAIWIHAGAEHFVLRKVHFRPVDATTVALTSGVANGERIVTEGAGLLVQVR